MQFIKGIILTPICLLATDVFAQRVNIRHLRIDDGLSQNAVYTILQDSRSFFWFGTKGGLNRYNWRNFVVHQHAISTLGAERMAKTHGGTINIKTKEPEEKTFTFELHV